MDPEAVMISNYRCQLLLILNYRFLPQSCYLKITRIALLYGCKRMIILCFNSMRKTIVLGGFKKYIFLTLTKQLY